ncbi:MAG: sigma-70 family RNA polymerase sigma factor [Chitinophagaceae bacterium]|jgi:RNA polymerase sigma-70 factor (ECF subfamily)|nr:sigma-70 family RNA polymerase sigma factor [Chitinophagaceae bacterium]MBK8785561.1 sigma-70 family RNA polymerase sigma factor [Chitinophagaceae bacterium]MBK9486767.1 sigma-70 family RNA polymerase sigma factor [Chitinophagaceae bacterium]MBL0199338.1 sigma-70 family RNA polymerase sigma factor [Chitinophagaceae bacterium]
MKSLITLTDEQLIASFKEGNAYAMGVLVSRHKVRIYTSIYVLVKDKYLAEDIFQDLFIKVIETFRAGKYKEENRFVQWAMRIAHNLCVDHFRKIKTKPVIRTSEGADIFDVLNFAEPSAEDNIMRAQSNEKIMNLICLLPEDQREIIILRHFADLKFREISNILNCSVNTALGRMRYALLNLRKLIEEKQIAL